MGATNFCTLKYPFEMDLRSTTVGQKPFFSGESCNFQRQTCPVCVYFLWDCSYCSEFSGNHDTVTRTALRSHHICLGFHGDRHLLVHEVLTGNHETVKE